MTHRLPEGDSLPRRRLACEPRVRVEPTTVRKSPQTGGSDGRYGRVVKGVSDAPAAFSKLAGHLVCVWFESAEQLELGKPHERSDTAALDALVKALAEYE